MHFSDPTMIQEESLKKAIKIGCYRTYNIERVVGKVENQT